MPLSPNEIRDRALAFARDWEGEKRERAEAQTFWNEFFHVFGVSRRRLASFEEPVKRARQRAGTDLFGATAAHGGGFIDLFWKGVLIAEHKSRGKNLDTAYEQALDYFEGIKERDLPHYVIVSDFARIRLYDLEADTRDEIALADLYKHSDLFGFIAGYTPQRIAEQDPVNVKAAERMGRLYDQLRASGYDEHALKVLLVRLLFCLFAEDTTLFEPKGAFQNYIEDNTREDGSDLGSLLNYIFQVLNTPEGTRQKNLDERLSGLPYVNGKLFEEPLPIAAFTGTMRQTLLDCCALDWARISPAIFGALFQSVMDKKARRHLGAHYTSERNILKLIKPLFLDELRAEFEKSKRSRNRLFQLHKKLAALNFLDPACGCGNFLVIAYRELRELELDILKAERAGGEQLVDVQQLLAINVDQFYGIELEEFPAQIAQVALWLADHQMNLKASQNFGFYYRRLPLTHSATIRQGNALALDWNEVIPAERVSYILGNPPFVGKQYQDAQQKADMARVWHGVKSAGLLDYVTGWYAKAAGYLRGEGELQRFLDELPGTAPPRERVQVAFVSTNSISQGEQVGVLWGEMFRLGAKIHFAHRTFQWSSEAPGKAAVHCVIVGWALFDTNEKRLFEYADIQGEPQESAPANINPYLVDAPDVLIAKRRQPLTNVPVMSYGSKPVDGGNLIFTDDEKDEFLEHEPRAERLLRPFMGADELLYNYRRWCLWLKDVDPGEWRPLGLVKERVAAVRDFRLESRKEPTRDMANYPMLFAEDRQSANPYLALPEVSGENRSYIPMALFSPSVIASNLLYRIDNAGMFEFGVLSSAMHMAWVRYVAGRLESRYRYSNQIVYNNFPWPDLSLAANQTSNAGNGLRPYAGLQGSNVGRDKRASSGAFPASDAERRQRRSAPYAGLQEGNANKRAQTIETAAEAVLAAREKFPDASLADLYDPVTMPPVLRESHVKLDRAVDAAYGKRSFASDAERVAYLFDLYNRATSLLPATPKSKARSSRRTRR